MPQPSAPSCPGNLHRDTQRSACAPCIGCSCAPRGQDEALCSKQPGPCRCVQTPQSAAACILQLQCFTLLLWLETSLQHCEPFFCFAFSLSGCRKKFQAQAMGWRVAQWQSACSAYTRPWAQSPDWREVQVTSELKSQSSLQWRGQQAKTHPLVSQKWSKTQPK